MFVLWRPLNVAKAVYLHGLAGDIAASLYGQQSMIATDIINCLGEAFAVCEAEVAQQVHLSPAMKTVLQPIPPKKPRNLAVGWPLISSPAASCFCAAILGAGKTTMVKGIAEGFQAAKAEDVTSPTFTLIHEYRGPAVTLYHIDLYRIDTQRELDTLGT